MSQIHFISRRVKDKDIKKRKERSKFKKDWKEIEGEEDNYKLNLLNFSNLQKNSIETRSGKN